MDEEGCWGIKMIKKEGGSCWHNDDKGKLVAELWRVLIKSRVEWEVKRIFLDWDGTKNIVSCCELIIVKESLLKSVEWKKPELLEKLQKNETKKYDKAITSNSKTFSKNLIL